MNAVFRVVTVHKINLKKGLFFKKKKMSDKDIGRTGELFPVIWS